MIRKLLDIINRETINFEQFLNLLEQQQKLIGHECPDELLMLTDKQQELMITSQSLYEERLNLIRQLKKESKYKSNRELKRLTDTIEQTQANRLLVLQELLVKINNDITRTRFENNNLLKRSREYIFKNIKILSNMNNLELNQSVTDAICRVEGCAIPEIRETQRELSLV
jgi:hypothetical protein